MRDKRKSERKRKLKDADVVHTSYLKDAVAAFDASKVGRPADNNRSNDDWRRPLDGETDATCKMMKEYENTLQPPEAGFREMSLGSNPGKAVGCTRLYLKDEVTLASGSMSKDMRSIWSEGCYCATDMRCKV